MTWLTFLIAAVVVATLAALTGIKPAGTRKVAGTQLMTVARAVLVLVALVLVYLAMTARSGG